MAQTDMIFSGFGGQGIQSAGRLIAYAGMLEDKHVSFLPSYGPEMRGGTSNCHVIVSDEPVGSPILNSATVVMAMNRPSMDKFESYLEPGGILLIDSSLINREPVRKDIKVFAIPATQIASDMGNLAFANIVMLGKLIKETGVVSTENFERALKKVLPERKHYLIPDEMKALKTGMDY
ncbi:MAG: 2-oxoacid:acceptor oxidoreductase family protein [Acetivibrionales bacterium]|jgi:2-oxoglutarate ferredoxin oxidoreductase subunit gamma|nr:2-oxoacid:acceptor oxidoreductase family protein [Bacillota bacterium]NLP07633.1 2-oxoacid:ferredoxin oxidoreductase subunit gamma [Clostridiaceae bacterium]HOA54255.1 2-oxoacid:acceptor oxidoreductase family protein [Clostridiales bacterium]HPZ06377.1 2-oxoacid:acceptor oxidoreductase family protein [Clostridiales bacterium]HQD30602.1 2-oxoacid:acceptor oxidoreductase family protein [Clostridiales bacterium]